MAATTNERGQRIFFKDAGLHDTVAMMTEEVGPSGREIEEALEKAEETFDVLRRAGLPEFEIQRFKESVSLVAPQSLAATLRGDVLARSNTGKSHQTDDVDEERPWTSESEGEDAEGGSEKSKGGFSIDPKDIYLKGAVERLQMGQGGFSSVWKKRWTVVTRGMIYCFNSALRPEKGERPEFSLRLASHITKIHESTFAFKEKFEREYCITIQSTGRGKTQKGKAQRQLCLAFKDEPAYLNWIKCLERATVTFNLDAPKPSLYKACQHVDLGAVINLVEVENVTEFINDQNVYKCTALHYAVKASCNAAKDARKKNEHTPQLENSFTIVAMLMSSGANPHIKDNLNRTCFEIVEIMAAGLPRTKLTLLDLLKSSKYEFDGEGTVYIFPADYTKLKRRIAGHLTQELNEFQPPSIERGNKKFQLRPDDKAGVTKGAKSKRLVATMPAFQMAHSLQTTMGVTGQKARKKHHSANAPGFAHSLYSHQKLPTGAQTRKVGTVKDNRDPLAQFYQTMARETQQNTHQDIPRRSKTAGEMGTGLGRTKRRPNPRRSKTAQGKRLGASASFPALTQFGETGAIDTSWGFSDMVHTKQRSTFRPGTAPAANATTDLVAKTQRLARTTGVGSNKGDNEVMPSRKTKNVSPMSNAEANRVISYWRATNGVPRPVKEIMNTTMSLDERSEFVAFSDQAELIDAFRAMTDDPTSEMVPVTMMKEFLTSIAEVLTDEEAEEMIEEADPTGTGFINYVRFIKHMKVSRLKPLPKGQLFFPEDDPIHQFRLTKAKALAEGEKDIQKVKKQMETPAHPAILFRSSFKAKRV